jgi:hypothetical protein
VVAVCAEFTISMITGVISAVDVPILIGRWLWTGGRDFRELSKSNLIRSWAAYLCK